MGDTPHWRLTCDTDLRNQDWPRASVSAFFFTSLSPAPDSYDCSNSLVTEEVNPTAVFDCSIGRHGTKIKPQTERKCELDWF